MFENSKWIANRSTDGNGSYLFRKELAVEYKPVQQAILSVCGLG